MPTASRVTAAAFDFSQKATTSASGTTVTWTEPMPDSYAPTNQQNFIWAHNPDDLPGTSDPNATLKYHGPNNRGFYSLDLTKPYTGAAVTSSGSSTSGMGAPQRDLSKMTTRVLLVHVVSNLQKGPLDSSGTLLLFGFSRLKSSFFLLLFFVLLFSRIFLFCNLQ